MFCMLMHAAMMGSHQGPQPTSQPGPGQGHHETPQPSPPVSALELLKLRYVKGEITRAQFEEMRQVLAETEEG